MNTLSWLIYLSDVIPRFGTAVVVLPWIALIVVTVYAIIRAIDYGDSYHDDNDAKEQAWQPVAKAGRWVIGLAVTAALATLLVSFVPSKSTILLIAGSETAETVVASDEGQEIIGLVKEKLKDMLEVEAK